MRFFRRDARGTSRTRLSAREAGAMKQTSTPNRHVYVSWRAQVGKKAREYLTCRLRINKVFVYFTNLKMRVLKSTLKFLKCAPRSDERAVKTEHGILIHTDMHKPTSFLFNRLA